MQMGCKWDTGGMQVECRWDAGRMQVGYRLDTIVMHMLLEAHVGNKQSRQY